MQKLFKDINEELINILKINLESIVLFGSYARNEEKESSDIDILIIVQKKINENILEKKIRKINSKVQILSLSKEEFRERILSFNHQLITLFYDGIIMHDENKFYYKMENLFLALYRKKKKKFTLKIKNKKISLDKLRRLKNYI